MQGSETYDPLSGQEDGDGQIVWSDTSRLYPKKKKSHSKWETRMTDFRLLWKKRTCPLVAPIQSFVVVWKAHSLVMFVPISCCECLSGIHPVCSLHSGVPPHQSYQSAPQLLAARAAATGMRNTGSTEKPFSQLCLDTCRRYDDRGF